MEIQELPYRALSYTGIGLVSSALTASPVTVLQNGIFGLANATGIQVLNIYHCDQKITFQRVALITGAIALTTFISMTAASTLLGAPLTFKACLSTSGSHLIGEMLFALWNRSASSTTIACEKVLGADKKQIKAWYSQYKLLEGDQSAFLFLHTRFYEEDLDLPPEISLNNTKTMQMEKLSLPTTAEEVTTLSPNKLRYLLASIRQHNHFKEASLEVRFALHKVMLSKLQVMLPFNPKTEGDIQTASEEIIRELHTKYTASTNIWNIVTSSLKQVANARFKTLGLDELSEDFTTPTTAAEMKKLEKEEIRIVMRDQEQLDQLPTNIQQVFWARATALGVN